MEGVWTGAEAYSQKARYEHVPLYLMLLWPWHIALESYLFQHLFTRG